MNNKLFFVAALTWNDEWYVLLTSRPFSGYIIVFHPLPVKMGKTIQMPKRIEFVVLTD